MATTVTMVSGQTTSTESSSQSYNSGRKDSRNNGSNNSMKHRINTQIRGVMQVRLVDDSGSTIVSIQEALKQAEEAGLDLVEVNRKADPVVCKILDYGKFLFEEKKKEKEQRRNNNTVPVKEVYLHTGISDNDFLTKVNYVKRFFEDGCKAKVTVTMSRKEMENKVTRDFGMKLVENFLNSLESYTIVQPVKQEGKNISFVVEPVQSRK